MRKRAFLAGLLAAATACGPVAALAADPGQSGPPDGTILLTAKAAAVGVGYTWGDGVLHYHGRNYHFSVKGISIADVGYASVTGRGRVYNLKRVADFSGTYGGATGNATLGDGIGGQFLRNGNGVEIRVDQVSKGARLTGAADGIQLTLNP